MLALAAVLIKAEHIAPRVSQLVEATEGEVKGSQSRVVYSAGSGPRSGNAAKYLSISEGDLAEEIAMSICSSVRNEPQFQTLSLSSRVSGRPSFCWAVSSKLRQKARCS